MIYFFVVSFKIISFVLLLTIFGGCALFEKAQAHVVSLTNCIGGVANDKRNLRPLHVSAFFSYVVVQNLWKM